MELKKGLLLISFAFMLSFSLARQCTNHSAHSWKYFVFSQWWPQSQCYYRTLPADSIGHPKLYNDYAFKNACVPLGVEGWTIHGLWPTINGSPNPCDCNMSWPFDVHKIKDLRPKMMKQWLSFPDTTESKSLWSHEWVKHGTCASSLPAVNSEHDYFYKALTLNLHYSLVKMFDAESLSPSDEKTYHVEDFENAIMKEHNVKGRVICIKGPDGDQYLGGVRICLDKNFKLIDCLVTERERCSKGALKYPVIIRH